MSFRTRTRVIRGNSSSEPQVSALVQRRMDRMYQRHLCYQSPHPIVTPCTSPKLIDVESYWLASNLLFLSCAHIFPDERHQKNFSAKDAKILRSNGWWSTRHRSSNHSPSPKSCHIATSWKKTSELEHRYPCIFRHSLWGPTIVPSR